MKKFRSYLNITNSKSLITGNKTQDNVAWSLKDERTKTIMASAKHRRILTDDVIEELSKVIGSSQLESIAFSYLEFKDPEVSAIRFGCGTGQPGAIKFNRDILKRWRNRCRQDDQIEVGFQCV